MQEIDELIDGEEIPIELPEEAKPEIQLNQRRNRFQIYAN